MGLYINIRMVSSDVNGSVRPGIVHRIDKETSGLLVRSKKQFISFKFRKAV
jgi:23S rRNA-/tRNA-specific pseudouridylate synthase